jgi:competence protein ComEA
MITRDAHMALLVLLGSAAAVGVARVEAHQHSPRAAAAPQKQPLAPDGEGSRCATGGASTRTAPRPRRLELLPGIGPSLARRIVAERSAHGPFASARELRRVKGIGDRTLKRLEPWLRFGSEQVEHAAQPQLGLRHGAPALGLPENAGS